MRTLVTNQARGDGSCLAEGIIEIDPKSGVEMTQIARRVYELTIQAFDQKLDER